MPGLAAKPLIDMLPELNDHDDGAELAPLLEPLGFVYLGSYGIQGRHFFRRKADVNVNVLHDLGAPERPSGPDR